MLCQVCFQRNSQIDLDLEQSYCETCLFEWMKENITQNMANLNPLSVPSLIPDDPRLFSFEQLTALLSPETRTELEYLQAKRLMMHTQDFIQCTACDYYGFITPEQEDCNKPFQCQKCCNQWRLKQHLRSYQKKCFLIRYIDDSFTNLNKIATGQPCPSCEAIIYKNGGCPYIQCTKCKAEFCWICLKDYNFHLRQINICYLRNLYLWIIYSFLLAICFTKLSLNIPILYAFECWLGSTISLIGSYIGSALYTIIYYVSFLGSYVVIAGIFNFCKNVYNNLRTKSLAVKICCLITCFIMWIGFYFLLRLIKHYVISTPHFEIAIAHYLGYPLLEFVIYGFKKGREYWKRRQRRFNIR